MARRNKHVLLGLAALVVCAAVILPFAVRWSRTCAEERARAGETWTAYAAHVRGSRAEEEARALFPEIDGECGQ